MKINALAILIIFILLTSTGISLWYFTSGSNPFNGKPIFTPPPLKLFQHEAAGTLTVSGIISETNRHREEHNMIALQENDLLNLAAERKARDILEKQYFDHVSPDGVGPSDIVDTTDYVYLSVGENLALGDFQDDADVTQAWMDSPGHRANILSSGFTEIGVAAVKGEYEGQEAWVGVQMFGLPESACPTPDNRIRSQFDQQKKNVDAQKNRLDTTKATLDQEIASLEALQREINELARRGKAKVEEGNADIRRGNEIYEETGDKEKAQPYWDSGEAKQKEGNALIEQAKAKQGKADAKRKEAQRQQDAYNKEVTAFQSETDTLKDLGDRLNREIREYNRCLDEYK